MPDRIPGKGDDIEVGGLVGFEYRHLDEREAEDSVEEAAHLLGNRQGAPALDPGEDFQEIGTPDLKDRLLAQIGQDVLAEDAQDLGVAASFAGLDALFVAFDPDMEHGFEGVLAGEQNGLAFLFAVRVRIGALGEQGARFVAGLTRFP